MKNSISKNFKNYIISYEMLDTDRIKINSSDGRYRIIKNNKKNAKKLDQIIVKSKVEISSFIDEYNNNFSKRVIPFIISSILIILSGLVAISTFFMGSYFLFVGVIICFGINIVCISILSFDYLIKFYEVRHLKKITGYKKEYEFEMPKLKVNMFTK